MDPLFVTIATVFLTLVGAICLWGIYADLVSDRSRMAHELHDIGRKESPLNFWLGVLSKGAGIAVAVTLIVLLDSLAA